uniref:Uncharacterized protein n=1 Tax=Oryza sativa subsp. japonica TaxID=39947 RepID=Q6Z524_ORYSJ|nr:hypothetical protein [Oryza sativa Japonica Group]BAD10159.1 hypothetical protein [Oryza sativa Japonica Group]
MPRRRPGEAVAVHWLRHAMFDAAGDDGAAGGGHGRFMDRNKKFSFLSEIMLLQYELTCLTRLNFDDERINSEEASTFMVRSHEDVQVSAAADGERQRRRLRAARAHRRRWLRARAEQRWGKRSKGAGGVAGERLRAAAGIGPTGGTRVVVVLRVADCRPSHQPSSQPRSSLAGYRPLPVAPASSPPPKAAPALFPDRPPDAPAAPALLPCWPCSSRGEENYLQWTTAASLTGGTACSGEAPARGEAPASAAAAAAAKSFLGKHTPPNLRFLLLVRRDGDADGTGARRRRGGGMRQRGQRGSRGRAADGTPGRGGGGGGLGVRGRRREGGGGG